MAQSKKSTRKSPELNLDQVISSLLDDSRPFPHRALMRLSDLGPAEMASVGRIWDKISVGRRRSLLEEIVQLNEEDLVLDFSELARFAVQDPDAKVRVLAVQVLGEYEERRLALLFLNLLQEDPDAVVRATAAAVLGHYVYMGEIEELEPGLQADIENQLLLVANSSAPEPVRRNALESLGFASRGEVTILIEQAYISTDEDWVASALVAMGRSANMKWAPQVMNMLDSDAAQIREQAARAAGELELGAARPRLLELLDDDDEDVIAASIWSLSQIGGEGVSAALEALYDEAEDDDTASYIEAALDNLAFNQELQLLDLVEPGEDDEYYDDLIADDEEEDDDEDEADDQEDPSGKGAKRRA